MALPKPQHELQAQISRAEWNVISSANAWIDASKARLVMERRAGNLVEQQIALPNSSALPGDNFVFLRIVPSSSPGTMQQDRVLEQAGGLPYPFAQDDLASMRGRTDTAGVLNWTEWSDGAGTTCVLALRRLTVADRVLPQQAGAIDLVMRNCVRGEAPAALAAAGPDTVAYPGRARPMGEGTQRTLSPLAAPAP